MARTLLATLPAAALALRAARTTVSMHTNIFPTFTIKDKAAVLGQRPIQAAAAGFFLLGASVDVRMVLLPLRERAAAAARGLAPFGDARATRQRRAARAVYARGERRAQTTTPYQHRPSPSSTSASRTRRPKVAASTTAGR